MALSPAAVGLVGMRELPDVLPSFYQRSGSSLFYKKKRAHSFFFIDFYTNKCLTFRFPLCINKNVKGPNFEREICKRLSLWLTAGERDDVLWRTHGSGARATRRYKSGKSLRGQEGDISAVDSAGQAFCNNWIVSLKTGYCRKGYFDVLDVLDSRKKTPIFLKWWREIKELATRVGRKPLLIFRRERRSPVFVVDTPLGIKPEIVLSAFGTTLYLYAFNIILQSSPKLFVSGEEDA